MNIAEKLKDAPIGTKLYSPIFGEVELNEVNSIFIDVKHDDLTGRFYSDGKYTKNGECMLFPSRDNRDWDNFYICPFKKGDFIVKESPNDTKFIAIFSHFGGFCKYTTNYLCLLKPDGKFKPSPDFGIGSVQEVRLATDSEKKELLDAIERNGYYWDECSMTLKKLTLKFKVGDTIYKEGNYLKHIIKAIAQDRYICENNYFLRFIDQNDWNIAKFDIDSLKPFDKVLVRDSDGEFWNINLFSHYNKMYKAYTTIRGAWEQCIPYNEETKHLVGTTNDCLEYYKTW